MADDDAWHGRYVRPLGETFVIGGTVLVAAGVFLSDKRRQLTR